MKATETLVPTALREVWEWKEAVHEDTKDMTDEEQIAYFRKGLEEAAEILGARLEKNANGTYSFVRG